MAPRTSDARSHTIGLLPLGLAVFVVGVVVNYLGGEGWRTPALVVEVAGAAILFANAARSRRRGVGRGASGE